MLASIPQFTTLNVLRAPLTDVLKVLHKFSTVKNDFSFHSNQYVICDFLLFTVYKKGKRYFVFLVLVWPLYEISHVIFHLLIMS